MAPKKAAAEAAPPPPPPPVDPIVEQQQKKMDKWQSRVSDVNSKHSQYEESQRQAQEMKSQFERELASLLERATELATMRVFGIVPPSQAAAAQAAAAPAASGKPLAGKGAKGKPEPPPPPPPPEVPLTEEEIKKRGKITNALLSLYKRKRDPSMVVGGSAAGGVAEASTLPSPSTASVIADVPNKPNEVPEEYWTTMKALREDRLATEGKLAAAVQALKILQTKLSSVVRMEHVAAYALQGSNHELKLAEERHMKELQLAKEQQQAAAAAASAVAASPGPGAASPPKGKK